MDRSKAIEIIKSQCPANKQLVDALAFLIPELKESEEDRIRKNLLELFHDTVSNDEIFSNYGLDKTEVLAWLEKQCEPQAKDFEAFIKKLSEQFPEVSFAKLSRIAVRVKNYLEVKKYFEQYSQSNAKSNGIWHDADETPVANNRQILVLFKDSGAMVVPGEDFDSLDNQLKWAYLNDLIK